MSINYVSCGRLGDFIDELSIVKELFLKTGKKGNVYMVHSIHWSQSLESTFKYIKDIIHDQDYINDIQIYNNEHIDVDLSLWRRYICFRDGIGYLESDTVPNIISSLYNIRWASHIWMEIDNVDPKWSTTTFINATDYRPILCDVPAKDVYFIGIVDEHYEHFKKTNNIDIPLYKPKNFRDLCICLKSCKTLICGLSMYCSLARALGTDCKIAKHTNDVAHEMEYLFPDLDKYMKYVKYI